MAALPPEPRLKTSPTIGYAPSAEWGKKTLKKWNNPLSIYTHQSLRSMDAVGIFSLCMEQPPDAPWLDSFFNDESRSRFMPPFRFPTMPFRAWQEVHYTTPAENSSHNAQS